MTPPGRLVPAIAGRRGETMPRAVLDDVADDEVVVALDEALLSDGLADARWMLHDALLSGARTIVVDLSGVERLSSPALASFLWAHRICRARGGGVVLRGADRRTRDVLYRTGLWRVLRLEGKRPLTAA
jgi:anti-anti-sigma factor